MPGKFLVLSLVLILAFAGRASAQVADPAPNPELAYQGRLTESNALVTGTRPFVFSILDSTGNELWNSGPQNLTVVEGLYGIVLGATGMPAISASLTLRANLHLHVLADGVALAPDISLIPALQASTSWSVTGPFFGDISGTQQGISVDKLKGIPIDLTGLTAGRVLTFDGTSWTAAAASGGQGLQGPPGPTGATGANGRPGSPGPAGATGATGPPGPAGAAGTTGAPGTNGSGFNFRNAFDASASYAIDDVATFGGSSYLAIAANSGPSNPTPAANPSAWSVMAQAGAAGTAGAPGSAGTPGATGSPGPTGPQGPAGATGTNGSGFNFRNAFDASVSYAIDDVATFSGSTYLAIAANSGPSNPTPAANPSAWSVMAQEGAAGTAGAPGSAGTPGATGSPGPTGPQGPTGATGTNGSGFNFRNAFDASASYAIGDVATFSGSTYVAIATSTGPGNPIPAANPIAWTVMAQEGAAGTAGAPGSAGAPGATGSPGPAGAAGSNGSAGAPGPPGPAGASPFTLDGSDAVFTTGSVGIGVDPPSATAVLDVASTNKGLLAPRMTTLQRQAIASPANGLIVFDTDAKSLQVYDAVGTVWDPLGASTTSGVAVTSVGTSAPLTGGPITSTGTIGINRATSTQAGYLAASDFSNFATAFSWGNHAVAGYLKADGSVPVTGNLNLGGNLINNVGAPLVATDAVNKTYVDSVAAGVQWKPPVIDLLSTPPGSPADGDRYIVLPPGTGAWTGEDNTIATWNAGSSSWSFGVPTNSESVFASVPKNGYVFLTANNAWVQFTGGAIYAFGGGLSFAAPNVSIASGGVTTSMLANGAVTAPILNSLGATTGQVMTFNGSNWAPATSTAGAVSVVSGTSPISVATGTTTPAISLGTVPLANGGTGAITAAAAMANLLPSQNGNVGKVLATDGTNPLWSAASGGTVTSVSGTSPISVATGTTTPAISLGTVPIANGGTGAITAAAAITNLLPSQNGNGGKVLATDGTNPLWSAASGGTVTSVTGTSPISVVTGTTTPAISLGTVPIPNGGTGAITAAAAMVNLLPSQNGNVGKVLATDGTNPLWSAASGGTVTSVSGTSPISVATGTTTPAISLGTVPVGNGGTGATTLTGYLLGAGTSAVTASATIPGTAISGNISGNAASVTGTVAIANGGTGAATATAAATNLLPPQAGNAGKALTTNGTVASWGAGTVGTVTSVTGTSPIVVATGTTTPAISLSTVPVASGGTGATTFAQGAILFGTTTTPIAGAAGLFWDSVHGQLGVGTTTPAYPLQVAISVSANIGSYGFLNSNSTGTASGVANVSIYANGRVVAQEVDAISDARIKNVIGRSDPAFDLETLKKLKITNYRYIDAAGRGNQPKKGVIAQEVEKVYPDAVRTVTDFIPSVYVMADDVRYDDAAQELTVIVPKAHGFAVGDMVRIITANAGTMDKPVVAVLDDYTFVLSGMKKAPSQVFVFGKKVDDFRVVDYDQLFILNLGATQRLAAENQALKTRIAVLEQAVAVLQKPK